jgi:predicted RNase H-like nuclease (RuvC/YqgF family)
MLGWLKSIGKYFVMQSYTYREIAEKLVEARRENFGLKREFADLEDSLADSERENAEASAELESARTELNDLGFAYQEMRHRKNLIETEVRQLREVKQNSIPIPEIQQIVKSLENLKLPAIFLSPDFVPLYANPSAERHLGRRVIGKMPLEFLSEDEVEKLRHEASAKSIPFTYDFKGSKLHNWVVAPVKENGRLLGCFITNQRGTLAYLWDLFSFAKIESPEEREKRGEIVLSKIT